MKIGFQGQRGAYSEIALRQYFGKDSSSVGFDLSESVFEKLDSGELDVAFLPVENSIAGNVAVNIDLLNTEDNFIIGEHYFNVNHCILAKPGIGLKDVKFAHSHPVALAQCRDFLKAHGITPVPALDTAGAAKELSENSNQDHAVICSSLCSDYYKLNILKEKIQTVENNITRFVAVIKKKNKLAGLKQEKTSLSFSANHEPGALMKCLRIFSDHNINLTKLESRPVPSDPFHYTFFVDFIGCADDQEVEKCLVEIKRNVQYIRVLGSYPRTRRL